MYYSYKQLFKSKFSPFHKGSARNSSHDHTSLWMVFAVSWLRGGCPRAHQYAVSRLSVWNCRGTPWEESHWNPNYIRNLFSKDFVCLQWPYLLCEWVSFKIYLTSSCAERIFAFGCSFCRSATLQSSADLSLNMGVFLNGQFSNTSLRLSWRYLSILWTL